MRKVFLYTLNTEHRFPIYVLIRLLDNRRIVSHVSEPIPEDNDYTLAQKIVLLSDSLLKHQQQSLVRFAKGRRRTKISLTEHDKAVLLWEDDDF